MISSFSYIFFLYKYMVNKVNTDETYSRYIPETLQIFPIFFQQFLVGGFNPLEKY